MEKSRAYLIAGGVISMLLAIFHLILVFKPELYRYIDPGQGSVLSQMAEQGSSLTMIATIALVLIFAIWAIYAFSAAGLIPSQPLQRAVLFAIAAIYILRGQFLFSEIKMVLDQDYPLRFVFFSTLSLVTGLLYLIGTLKLGKRS
jgi:hypothetical protein